MDNDFPDGDRTHDTMIKSHVPYHWATGKNGGFRGSPPTFFVRQE